MLSYERGAKNDDMHCDEFTTASCPGACVQGAFPELQTSTASVNGAEYRYDRGLTTKNYSCHYLRILECSSASDVDIASRKNTYDSASDVSVQLTLLR